MSKYPETTLGLKLLMTPIVLLYIAAMVIAGILIGAVVGIVKLIIPKKI